MCTVSVLRAPSDGGFALWFNRDEKRARAPEQPPRAGVTAGGTRYVAPLDGERGGTWLLLNARGLVVCVLNDYESAGGAGGVESRGRLPLAAADAATAGVALAALRAHAEARGATGFGPFRALAADARGGLAVWHWDGGRWRDEGAREFVTSSSWRSAEVQAARTESHTRVCRPGRDAARLAALHWSHDSAAGAESVRMSRADACTRSVCAVRVGWGGGVSVSRSAGGNGVGNGSGNERGDVEENGKNGQGGRGGELKFAAAPVCELVYTAVDWERPDGLGARTKVAP